MSNTTKPLEVATLGTGCFWCTEAIFQALEGVEKVVSGYSGGHVENPTYEQVCTKKTGHTEVVQITFNPSVIDFSELLDVFWFSHDPTTLNRQGNDVGPQYRSAIFYHDDEQRIKAETSKAIANNSGAWPNPIVTEITAFDQFYPAEGYHQNFYDRVGDSNPYCVFNISPKLGKIKAKFRSKMKNA